jgi:hypothetical protein
METNLSTSNSTPTATTGEFLVNTHLDGFQHSATVAALAGGGFVVTWVSSSTGIAGAVGSDIHAQLFDAVGNPIGSEFRVNTVAAQTDIQPAVAALPDGGFLVTWSGNVQLSNPSLNVVGQRFDANGAAVGGNFPISTDANSDNGQISSTVTVLDGGGFVVTWTASAQDGSGAGVFGRLFDATGAALGRDRKSVV